MRSNGARAGVVHIVQRMAPGGIETLVLDLFRSDPAGTRVLSLAGDPDRLVRSWPALAGMGDALEAFGQRPGLRPSLCWRLTTRLHHLKPRAVFLHHIGPLVYGGVAARLAGVPVLVHVEHDAWHYENPRHRFLLRATESLVRPRHVAVSRQVHKRLCAILPKAKVDIVAPGIDLTRFTPRSRQTAM